MEVFYIPHNNKHYIYFPLAKILLEGNSSLINLIENARTGDVEALNRIVATLSVPVSDLCQDSPKYYGEKNHTPIPPFEPTSISLFLTDDCTLRCRYCYSSGGHKKNKTTFEVIRATIDMVFNNCAKQGKDRLTINFHGGDVGVVWPLFVRTHNYILKKENQYGIKARCSAGLNGILNDEQRNRISRWLSYATLSVDGVPDIQDFQRPFPDGSGSFDTVAETLRFFREAHFKYGIRCTVTDRSVGRLAEAVEYLCSRYSVDSIKFDPMFPRGRGEHGPLGTPDSEVFVANYRKAKTVADRYGCVLSYSGARYESITSVFCQAAGESCTVTPEGLITSCYEVSEPTDPLAEVFVYGRYDYTQKRFVVDEERRRKLYELTVKHRPECEDCFCKWHCAGDCPAKALHTERILAKDFSDRCYINRELTKDQIFEAFER